MDEKTTVHTFIRRIAVNPVTGNAAVAVAVLAVVEAEEGAGASYESISRALSSDYINLYYVEVSRLKVPARFSLADMVIVTPLNP